MAEKQENVIRRAGQPLQSGRKLEARSARLNWILLISGFLVLMCVVAGGFAYVILTQSQQQGAPLLALQPTEQLAVYPTQALPPTWTATVTQTPFPSATFIPGWGTTTPVPSFKLTGPSVGLFAPDFALEDISGNTVNMSDYNGKAIFLLFWATWCPHCAHEVSSVQSVYGKYKDKGLVILAIDVGESAAKARSYRGAHNLTFTMLNDSNQTVAAEYHVTGFPTHFFVASNGQISSIVIGEINYASLVSKVEPLLTLAP